MEDQADPANGLLCLPESDSHLARVKRSIEDLKGRHGISPKRIKMVDLNSVISSEEINTHNSKSLKRKESSQRLQFTGEENASQVTELHPVSLPLDLNTDICNTINESSDTNPKCEENCDNLCSQESHCATSNRIGLDLNAEDVSSLINLKSIRHKHIENSKPRDVSECGSSIGPMGEKDSLRVWKEMKQNGFLSSSHGGISMQSGILSSSHGGIPVPKQRGRKSKNDMLKKKMELAKKEQVDRFTKIAAPSGLLNGLNPGIINHVRNRKQVHSIMEALVKSEKLENMHSQSGAKDNDGRKDHGNVSNSGLHGLSCYCENEPPNVSSMSNKTRDYLVPMHKPVSSILEKRRDGDSNLLDPVGEDDAFTLRLSSSTKASETEIAISTLSNEESANITCASSLSAKAATVASQWLELLHQDIKGRLSALRRSKKKVEAVITTELPFLISKEFSSNQGSDSSIKRNSADGFCHSHDAIAEMHRARWFSLFDRMEKALSEEEKHLESWFNQIKGMQLHCDQGLHHMQWNMPYGFPQLGAPANNIRSGNGDRFFDRDLAVGAAAASIYSTCCFMLSKEDVRLDPVEFCSSVTSIVWRSPLVGQRRSSRRAWPERNGRRRGEVGWKPGLRVFRRGWLAATTSSETVVLSVRTDIRSLSGSHKWEGDDVLSRLNCRNGFCFDNGVGRFLVTKRIIFYGRNEGELSLEELFLVWRSERFRKNKIGFSRNFLSGPLLARRCLPRSDLTSITSFLSLFKEKVQMVIPGRQVYKILVEIEGGCDRANVEIGIVTAANTQSMDALVNAEGRNHVIYAIGERYKVRVYSYLRKGNGNTRILPSASIFGMLLIPKLISYVLGHENPNLAIDSCLPLLSSNCFKIWPAVLHFSVWVTPHVSPCMTRHVSLYELSNGKNFKVFHVEPSILLCMGLSMDLKVSRIWKRMPIEGPHFFHVNQAYEEVEPISSGNGMEEEDPVEEDDLVGAHPDAL
ncbi:hypothetical protein GQ457_07G019710 [Hibiscus cannabinus]